MTSCISDIDPFELHSLFTITGPCSRSLTRVSVKSPISKEETTISMETSPCKILNECGLHPKDLVRISQKSSDLNGLYAVIRGSFAHFACIQCLNEEPDKSEIRLINVLSLELIRSDEPAIKKIRAFGGSIEEVNLQASKTDPLFPGDRILVHSKLGTVKGKDSKQSGYWVNFDDTDILNEGAVLISME